MKITVRTRSMNEKLFEAMRSMIPPSIEVVAHTGYSEWPDASRFLHDAIEMTDGILLVCDEDCFITDWKAIEDIAMEMESKGYVFSGIPDGGVIVHRALSWVTANPFFVLFNCDVIKAYKAEISRELIDWHGYDPKLEQHKPDFVLGSFNHGNQEPFNGLFYWLGRIGTPLYLNGTTMGDGIATEVKGLYGQPIAYHTWYSRDEGEANQARIKHIIQLAQKNKVS